jgi:DNA-binding IclR family transcriptional regulator
LEKELHEVREKGYAVDQEEMRVGVCRIAAPVYDHKATISACLGVAGPSFRITNDNYEKIGKWARKLARQLSLELKDQAGAGW